MLVLLYLQIFDIFVQQTFELLVVWEIFNARVALQKYMSILPYIQMHQINDIFRSHINVSTPYAIVMFHNNFPMAVSSPNAVY